MTIDIDNVRVNYLFRIRAAKAAGGFFLPVPKVVHEVIEMFEARKYQECKERCAKLMSEGLWVAFGTVVVQGCDELIGLEPPATSTKVEVIKR